MSRFVFVAGLLFSVGSCFWLGACSEEQGGAPPASGGSGGDDTDDGASGSGGDAGEGGSGGAPATTLYPPTLRETGLYAGEGEVLAVNVREYVPRYELSSDGALKRRFIALPPGARIDTSDPDYWDFPVGTKFWKEFSRDGVRVETRYLEKRQNGRYSRIAYQWNEAQTEARAVPEGVIDASGTDHDIPTREQCGDCHSQTRGEILGFSALQLAFDSEHLDAVDLIAENWVTDPIEQTLILPGDATAQAALGYLHVNCGTCHNPTSAVRARVDLDLRLRVGRLGAVEETPIAESAFDVPISLVDGTQPPPVLRIAPGDAETSAVFVRMNVRGEVYAMPPLGSELVDVAGSELIRSFIAALGE